MSGRVAKPDWVGEEEEEHNFEVVEGGYTVAQNTLIRLPRASYRASNI